jgi:hypothetical protein
MVNFTNLKILSRKRAPGTHWRGSWVKPRTSPDTVENKKLSCPYWELNPDSLAVQEPMAVRTEISQLHSILTSTA